MKTLTLLSILFFALINNSYSATKSLKTGLTDTKCKYSADSVTRDTISPKIVPQYNESAVREINYIKEEKKTKTRSFSEPKKVENKVIETPKKSSHGHDGHAGHSH